ncbi:MAG: hypothetical protein KDD45_04980, partial [Bdellovibrionales bacterium]|nr:hypothetical protein [Bdellovibrionales bacterium]
INPSTGDCDTGGVGTQQCLVLVKTGSDLSYLEGDFNGTSNLTELVGLEGFIDLFMINNSQLTGQGGSGIEGVGGGGQRFDGTTIAQTKIQNFNFAINSVVGYYKLYYQLEILNNSFGIVESSTSWRSKYVDISLVNNSGFGLVSSSWYVILQNIKAFNNTDYGVGIWGTGSVGKNILSVGNSTKGVDVSNSNSVLSNFTLVSNTTSGLVSSTCLSCLHDNILSSNNGTGIVVYSNAGVYSDIFLTENAKGIDFQSSSSGAEFKNNLFLGNTTNCTYTSIGANPGLTGVDCDNQNLSTATRTLGASALGYFKGKVTSEASNTHSTGVSVANAITDWLNFENFFRVWGNTASAVDLITMNKGACTGSNTCNIWDFGLSSSVSAIRNVHGSVINGATCPTSVQGDKVGLYQGTTPYLINATEIFGDRIGNDNGLCESNEECIFSPNIGAYQGEGDYTTTICQFENGVGSNAIVNVKMYAYPQ